MQFLLGMPVSSSENVFRTLINQPLIVFMVGQAWIALNLGSLLTHDPYPFLTAITTAVSFCVFYFAFRLICTQWIDRSTADQPVLHLSFVFLVALILAVCSRLLLVYIFNPAVFEDTDYYLSDPFNLLIATLLLWGLIELANLVVIRISLPSALREEEILAREHQNQSGLSASYTSIDQGMLSTLSYLPPASETAEFATSTSLKSQDREIILSDISFRSTEILAAVAQRNYVRIDTEEKSHLVDGPLAHVMDALEGLDGFQIHRSAWIALTGVKSTKRDGHKMLVEMKNGEILTVARPRIPEFRSWVAAAKG